MVLDIGGGSLGHSVYQRNADDADGPGKAVSVVRPFLVEQIPQGQAEGRPYGTWRAAWS